MTAPWVTTCVLMAILIGLPLSGYAPQMNTEAAQKIPHGQFALAFAKALAAGQFDRAAEMLTPELQKEYPPAALQTRYEKMFSYAGNVKADSVDLVNTVENWPEPTDLGWAYVSIGAIDEKGAGYGEAVAVTVTQRAGKLLIREIEWGRP